MTGVASRVEAMAGRRVAARIAALGARARGAIPEADVMIEPDAVRLTGRGLVALAFGSRRRDADPRFAALVQGDAP